jgi:transcriptional regulator with XRE-family HTH domain
MIVNRGGRIMGNLLFGRLFKELRQKKGYTLREYCRLFQKDPGNMSKMERGLLPPPTATEELTELALSLGLRKNAEEWSNFFTVAVVSAGKIPKEIMSDEEVIQHLPILLRTMTGQKIDENKLKALIEMIKSA